MTILVTGSTGFIGAALCRALAAQGHSLRAFHRANSNVRLLTGLAFEHAVGDITRPETLIEAMQGIDIVFHTAALMGAGRSNPGRYYTTTVEGTKAVLEAALEAGVKRFVHTSSVAALGIPPPSPGRWGQPALMDERRTWNYRADYWPYGYAKYLAEMEVQKAVAKGLDAVIVNPTIVLGAGDIYRQTHSIVMQVARRRVPVVAEGGLNVVHIADVVAGHLAALEHGHKGERYILGAENLTIFEFARRIAAVTGVPHPAIELPAWLVRRLATPLGWAESLLTLPVSTDHLHLAGYAFYYQNRKSRLELGLEYRHTTDQAIADAYAWFTGQGS
jgi:dihydroflavonol-4-reductase